MNKKGTKFGALSSNYQ